MDLGRSAGIWSRLGVWDVAFNTAVKPDLFPVSLTLSSPAWVPDKQSVASQVSLIHCLLSHKSPHQALSKHPWVESTDHLCGISCHLNNNSLKI